MKPVVRNRSKKIFLLMLFIGLTASTEAQLSQPNRFEKKQNEKWSDYKIVSLEEKGLALLQDNDTYKQGERQWQFIQLDTLLSEVWTTTLSVKENFRLVGNDYHNNNIYYLFRSGEGDWGDIKIFKIDIRTKQILSFDYKPELAIQLMYFFFVGNQIVLAGYVLRQPTVLLYNMQTNQAKIVPGLLADNTEILDVRANMNNTFNVLMSIRKSKHNKRLVLKIFDESGALLLNDDILIDTRRTIISGMTSTLERNELLLVGTWTEGVSQQATGVFTVLVSPDNEQQINYYDFGQLTHFFDYITPKRAIKIKEKSDDSRKAGKIPDFKTHFLPVRLLETKNGFVYFGEAYQTSGNSKELYWDPNNPYHYYPYGMNSYGYPDRFGGYPYGTNYPYNYGRTNSTEVKMQLACVIVFDQSGQLLADYGLNLDDIKTSSAEQVSDFIYTPLRTTLVFNNGNQIYTQVDKVDSVQSTNKKTEIELKQNGESIEPSSNQIGLVRHWYKNVLYLYGYQTIKSKKGENKDVFYINKLKTD